MIIILGNAVIDTSAIDDLVAAAATMMAESRKEAGCLYYSLSIEDRAAGIMAIAERWSDEAALKAHFKAPHMAAFNAVLAGKVKGLDVKMYDASGERGLGL